MADEPVRCAATTTRGKPCKLPVSIAWAGVPFCERHSPLGYMARTYGIHFCELGGVSCAVTMRIAVEESSDGSDSSGA